MIELTRRIALASLLAAAAAPAFAESHAGAVVEEMTLGLAEAPVTIIEYASFTCPHCANFHRDVFGKLKTDYIDTGKVRLIYREVYFDRYGLMAGTLARCGGAEKYFGIAEIIYTTQQEWIGDGEPATIQANLGKIGRTVGLPEEQVTACLSDQVMAEALVAEFRKNMEADQITGTPSFPINGEPHTGEMAYDAFRALVDAALPQ